MRTFLAPPIALAGLVVGCLAGCGNAASLGGPDAGAAGPDLTATPTSQRLVSSDYALTGGQEVYLCKRFTLTSDLLVRAITPSSDVGTHHQVLGVDPNKSAPDGLGPCGSNLEFDVASWQLLFASGVGSPTLSMPEGVALILHAGDQLVLQMHLLNASPGQVTGTASLDIATYPPGTPVTAAEMLLAGPVPDSHLVADVPTGPGHVVKGLCTMTAPTRLFAVFPHMHQIGRHIQVTTTVAGASSTLYDADYQFTEQVFKEFTPIDLAKGDSVHVTCTYDNETGKPVQFGQSSLQEMCFAISYVSPPLPGSTFGDFCFF